MNRMIPLAAAVVLLGIAAAPTIAAAQAAQGQDLPDGAAMPLGEFQEDLHLREGLPLIAAAASGAAVAGGWQMPFGCNTVRAALYARRSGRADCAVLEPSRMPCGSARTKNNSKGEKTMRIHWTAIAGMAVMLSTASHAQTNRLSAAAEAMGATTLNSIQYTGSGNVFSFGQAFEPGERWPRFVQRVYSAAINYQTPAMRLIQVRSQGEHPPRGGGAQAVAGGPAHGLGRQRQIRLAGSRRPGGSQSRRGRRSPACRCGRRRMA